MQDLSKLEIWNKAMKLTKEVYELTKAFPAEEKFALISQVRRCSISVPSNIAEGAGRNSRKEFVQFLAIANGSAYELQTQLTLAFQLGDISNEEFDRIIDKVDHIQKMNFNLQRSLKQMVA